MYLQFRRLGDHAIPSPGCAFAHPLFPPSRNQSWAGEKHESVPRRFLKLGVTLLSLLRRRSGLAFDIWTQQIPESAIRRARKRPGGKRPGPYFRKGRPSTRRSKIM